MNELELEKIIKKVCNRLEDRLDLSMEERERLEFLKLRERTLMKEIDMLRSNLNKICGVTGLDIRCVQCNRFAVSGDCKEVNQDLLECKNNHVPF